MPVIILSICRYHIIVTPPVGEQSGAIYIYIYVDVALEYVLLFLVFYFIFYVSFR